MENQLEKNMDNQMGTGVLGNYVADSDVFPHFQPLYTIRPHMSYGLKLLKGGYIGEYIGNYYRGY